MLLLNRLMRVVTALAVTMVVQTHQATRGLLPAMQASSGPSVDYFPKGTLDSHAELYSGYLRSIGEPSLLASEGQAATESYRAICLGAQRPNFLVIRLSFHTNGTVMVTTTTAIAHLSGNLTDISKAEHTATTADVDQFRGLLANASFWAMSTREPENPDPRLRVERNDAAGWVFEGVRRGTYHVVFREGPEQGPFTEMVRFLAKDIAKMEAQAVPYAFPPQPSVAIKTTKTPPDPH